MVHERDEREAPRLVGEQPIESGQREPVDDDYAAVRDAGADVAERINGLTRRGVKVQDLSLAGASLQDVFIGLTGRELRD